MSKARAKKMVAVPKGRIGVTGGTPVIESAKKLKAKVAKARRY